MLARIEHTLRRTFSEAEAEADDDGDVLDDLELQSDEELLTWFERIVGLDLLSRRPQPDDGRFYRLDPARV